MSNGPTSLQDPSLPILLRHARDAYGTAMRAALADAGHDDIPENGLHVIGGLARQKGDRPLSHVIVELGVSKQVAGQLVDTLVVRGYVRREVDAADRRKLVLALTDRGREAAKIIGAARRALDAALIARAGPRDVARTRKTLATLVEIARDRRER